MRADVLRAVGVRTVDDLAGWTGDPPDDWQHGPFEDAVVSIERLCAKVAELREPVA